MEKKLKSVVENYQCPGCTVGSNISCFKSKGGSDKACASHSAGTFISGIGRIFLGMPKGFNRAGQYDKMPINIFEKFADGWGYTKFNVPVWKYRNEEGHTIVRGISPRVNSPFLHIFLEDCLSKIECQEITDEDLSEMD